MNDDYDKMTQEEREKRVFNLEVELADFQNNRKSQMKAFTEEIKRVKAEIKDLIKNQITTENI